MARMTCTRAMIGGFLAAVAAATALTSTASGEVDVIAIDFRATDAFAPFGAGVSESVDETLVVPMPFLRAEFAAVGGPLGSLSAVGEVGYLEISDLGGTEGAFFDVEAILEYSPAMLPFAHAFVGYRYVDLDGSGDSGGDAFTVDLQLQGWTIGGGIRF